MTESKPEAGGKIPQISFPKLGGGLLSVGDTKERYTLFVIYRGKFCPKCKTYLSKLDAMRSDWKDAGFDIVAASADPEDRAAADVEEFGWSFDMGYDLSEAQMRDLGCYISDPLSEQETDRRFAEPAVFCIRPDGVIQIVCISNGPAARPDLGDLLAGMQFNISNDRPPRGTA